MEIGALDTDARGIARIGDREVHVAGALPGEEVAAQIRRRRRGRYEADVAAVLKASPDRVEVRCPHAAVCGGCSMQHMDHRAQLAEKQRRLLAALRRAQVRPERVLPPLHADPWAYRRKTRLGARYVSSKGEVLVGFRERHWSRVVDMVGCEVLDPAVGRRISSLRDLLSSLDCRHRIPQIEAAVADQGVVALVVRHLVPLSEHDRRILRDYARDHGVQVHLQSGGPDTVTALFPDPAPPLSYRLPRFGLEFRFQTTDFIQVNARVNALLVSQALAWLAVGGHERVLDLFCGIGNFTLPVARHAGHVLGLEGSETLTFRAKENAVRNGIGNAAFEVADLHAGDAPAPWLNETWDRLLLDPPRSGALRVLESLRSPYPTRVVYVSCNPQTLARDAVVLVGTHGYRLIAAGVVDMFPHTNHEEAMAVFERL